mgnify:CR=1 FL=1
MTGSTTDICLLIQTRLTARKFKYVRLDGTMKREDRMQALRQFSQDSDTTVMLISLRAGGVGWVAMMVCRYDEHTADMFIARLNLTMAQHVYLMEPYWYEWQ